MELRENPPPGLSSQLAAGVHPRVRERGAAAHAVPRSHYSLRRGHYSLRILTMISVAVRVSVRDAIVAQIPLKATPDQIHHASLLIPKLSGERSDLLSQEDHSQITACAGLSKEDGILSLRRPSLTRTSPGRIVAGIARPHERPANHGRVP